MYKYLVIILILFSACRCNTGEKNPDSHSGLHISTNNPSYWSYNGLDVMLIGGSIEDNLFQISGLEEHLNLLKSVGGNYVRNTMSSRDSGNLWPFLQDENGKYNLDKWNEAYWNRFSNFLKLTHEKEIIVQIELWATFDFYREFWIINPFNPANNVNYDERRSKLSPEVNSHPIFTENNFFRSVPSQMSLAPVLWYQQKYIDKLLSLSLNYDHVLYCMDNETSVTSEWGKYWAKYVQNKASESDKFVYTTEMWDPHDLSHPFHAETFDNPDIFTFVDISQNNHKVSDEHWNNGLQQLLRLHKPGLMRPANNVKVYGSDEGKFTSGNEGIENFVQNILMGCASSRFHRPPSGLGLNESAQSVITSMRQITLLKEFYKASAHNELLSDREEGEAYCRALQDTEYMIYFPKGGIINLDLSNFEGKPVLQWVNVMTSEWSEAVNIEKSVVTITSPDKAHQIAVIRQDLNIK